MVKKITATTSKFAVLKYVGLGMGCLAGLLVITVLVVPRPSYKTGMSSLPQVEVFAASLNEQYAMDNDNTIKPEFTKHWATVVPGKLDVIKEKLAWLGSFAHLAQPPVWAPSFFKNQLLSLTAAREAAGCKGDHIVKITATPSSRIVVFGYVQGAIHSLTRCLVQLKTLGIINDELVVTNPDFFIVFTGGIVSRSAHNMATLSLVCRLLEKNPQQVVYLRGSHETKGYWQEHALKNELVTFAGHLGAGDIPLVKEVNAFFDTLPVAAYVTMHGAESKDFIRISDAGRGQNEQLAESAYAGFLTSKSDKPVAVHVLAAKAEGNGEVHIPVIFKGEKKRESYQPHEGLRLLQADMDSVAWATLSCPTVVYQKAIKFMHDAFVVVAAGKQMADWTVTLYNRDVRTKDPFKATVFNLLTGADVATGNKPTDPAEKETDKKEKKEEKSALPPPGGVLRQAHEERGKSKDQALEKNENQKTKANAALLNDNKVANPVHPAADAKAMALKEPAVSAHPEPVEGRPLGVAERDNKKQTVALDTTTTSTIAHIAAIQKQLQVLTKEVEDLASSVHDKKPVNDMKTADAAPIEKKDKKQKETVPAQAEDAEASAFKPL